MEFRIEFKPPAFQDKMHIGEHVFLIGSCFTEHMFNRFNHYKFKCAQNPHGTLFNPYSIAKAINAYINCEITLEDDLFLHHGLWNHWDFHSSLSSFDKGTALHSMQSKIKEGNVALKSSDWLIITLGSAFIYELKDDGKIVANCHKLPSTNFYKRMMSPQEIIDCYNSLLSSLRIFNSKLKVIFTVSPVRHLKDGFVENNRSKASLILAIEEIIRKNLNCFYFPSYELLIDDLRDYRFYAEDMVHPNYQATAYIWQKFADAIIDGKSREVLKELDQVFAALHHKVMHLGSPEHLKFKAKYLRITNDIMTRFPEIDLMDAFNYFNMP